jgi:hypothetical protein
MPTRTKTPSFPPEVRTEPSPQDIREALTSIFQGMDEEELVATAEEFEAMERELAAKGPQNPDELWDWIAENLGIELTRHKVCEDHVAPFDVLCDAFFEERFTWPHPQLGVREYGGIGSMLVMANRGGSKTFLVALLHFLNSTFKPGSEGVTFGATEEQSKRCYNHLKPWVTVIRVDPKTGKKKRVERDGIEYSQRSETVWEGVDDAHGVPRSSKVEVLSGTPEAVNGPHPNVSHADEADLMRDDTFDESRNMAIAGMDAWGRKIMPRNIVTSTRKSKHGRMQQLIDEIKKAEAQNFIPSFTLCAWCIWETAAQVPNCRNAPENRGRPENELCECNRIPKGLWDDGTTRRLDQVCAIKNEKDEVIGGKLYLSRGWQPVEQIQELFRQNARPVWDAQQECREPETENNYIQGWRPERSVIQMYDPDPSLGPIFSSVDWGAGNPNAFHWYQYLYYEIEVMSYDWRWRTIPAGSLICFDEIYEADIGAGKLADKVVQREAEWRDIYPDFRVNSRFYDPAGRQSKLDFEDRGPRLSWWGATRDVQTGIDLMVDLHEGTHFDKKTHDIRGFLYCTASNEVQKQHEVEEVACPMWRLEVEFWRKNPKTGLELEELNHAMANCRYLLVNLDKGMGNYVSSHKAVQARESGEAVEVKRRHAHAGRRRGPLRFGGPSVSAVAREFGSGRI